MLTFNLNIFDNVYGDAFVDVVRVLFFEMLLKLRHYVSGCFYVNYWSYVSDCSRGCSCSCPQDSSYLNYINVYLLSQTATILGSDLNLGYPKWHVVLSRCLYLVVRVNPHYTHSDVLCSISYRTDSEIFGKRHNP